MWFFGLRDPVKVAQDELEITVLERLANAHAQEDCAAMMEKLKAQGEMLAMREGRLKNYVAGEPEEMTLKESVESFAESVRTFAGNKRV